MDYLELRKLQGHCYGILLWSDNNEEGHLDGVVESITHDEHFKLFVRGQPEPFYILDIEGNSEEVDRRLYEKAKELALEKSKLNKSKFVDSVI
jgi:hypothetical protein